MLSGLVKYVFVGIIEHKVNKYFSGKVVQVGNDEENVQSERNSHSKMWEKN